MIKVTDKELAELEFQYSGILEQIRRFDAAPMPACPLCGSMYTASIQIGAVGRVLSIMRATDKVVVQFNGPGDRFWCHACRQSWKPTLN